MIAKPIVINRRERRLSVSEYNFLVKGNYPQLKLRNIIELAIETGMRRGEILNIKLSTLTGKRFPDTTNKKMVIFKEPYLLQKTFKNLENSLTTF